MNRRLILLVPLFLLQIAPMPARADVTVPAMFGDHAVLQRGIFVPVWGTASAGESVTVSFATQELRGLDQPPPVRTAAFTPRLESHMERLGCRPGLHLASSR